MKADGDFGRAFGGISSLEIGPRAVWTHAAERGFGLDGPVPVDVASGRPPSRAWATGDG